MINTMFALGMPGTPEMIILLVIVVLLFGAKRLPDLARGVGKSIREFKKATSEVEDDIREALKEEPKDKKDASAEKTDSSDEEKKS